MVTRYIKKDTPTQVNSECIGVNIVLEGAQSFSGEYVRQYVVASSRVNVDGAWKGRLIVDDSDNVFYYTSTTDDTTIPGTRLYVYREIGDDGSGTVYVCLNTPPYMTTEDSIYTIGFDEELQENVLVEYSTLAYLPSAPNTTGTIMWYVDSEHIEYNNNTYTLATYKETSEELLVDSNNLYFALVVDEGSDAVAVSVVKSAVSTWEGKTEWIGGEDEDTYKVWTDSDNPEEGDTFYTSSTEPTFNQGLINEVIYDEPDCTVSYSVTGDTWTDWDENLTKLNNVINNIPRYMYLKFSQDVNITEE